MDVALLGIGVEMYGAKEATQALKTLYQTTDTAEQAVMRFSTAMRNSDAPVSVFVSNTNKTAVAAKAAGREMQNYGMHSANVFAQLNDIGMMMAAGQNPMMLALQQGTQLNQVWGQLGGKMSSVGAVMRGAFMSLLNPLNLMTIAVIGFGTAAVQWLFSAGEESKTFEETIDELAASIDNLNAITNLYTVDGVAKLREKYGELNAEIIALIENQRILALADAAAKLQASIDAIGSGLGDGLMNTAYGELERVFETTSNNAQVLYGVIENIGNLDTIDKQLFAITSMKDQLALATNNFTDMNSEQRAMFSVIIGIEGEVRALEKATKDAERATGRLATAAPEASWMSGAIGGVTGLIGKLREAVVAADILNAKIPTGAGMGRGSSMGGPALDPYGFREQLERDAATAPSGSSGGGGGGGSDPYQASLDRLIESLMTEREVIEEWYAESEALLNDKRALEMMGEVEHKAAMLALEEEYHDKIKGIRDESAAGFLGDTADLFGELYSLSGSHYDGLLKAQKAFAAAEALVNTYRAAAQVLADPSLSFFAKFSAVASVIAAGFGMVNAIKDMSSSGATASAPSSGAVPTEPTTPTQLVQVELMGSDFMVALAEQLLEPIYEATANGAVLVK